MDFAFSRRGLLHGAAAVGGALATSATQAGPVADARAARHPGWVFGRMTGAEALCEALRAEGVGCVYGIPGAQENELWDTFKEKGIPYLLVTHEFSAACMADGYARSTGRPGVLCVVPGPGVTNSLTGLGEALLDSSPLVAIVGDVANGEKAKPFQVHSLNQVELLKPVCKCVYQVQTAAQIAAAVRQAFVTATQGEPGPVAVVVPYNLFIEAHDYRTPPPAVPAPPFDEAAFARALPLLADKRHRVGIYAGVGCMSYGAELAAVAELLQAPIATSVSGRGAVGDGHPLAVGWGFGPHASEVAEKVFAGDKMHPLKSGVDTVLAIGVKFSEVSTGYYGNPQPKHVVHVDANHCNLGRVLKTDVCVHADAGAFLGRLLACGDQLRRPEDRWLLNRIRELKAAAARSLCSIPAAKCGVDPLATVAALRKVLPEDALLFTDVSVTEHLAAEHFRVCHPRTYFNPVDNQAMGWSVPAALGAQRVHHGKAVATITGDGCLLMSALEITTAAREHLPVKFVILDDQSYHYMQMLQKPAYLRTTATILTRLDYRALAQAFGVGYVEIASHAELEAKLRGAVCHDGPVLVRVVTDYGKREVRWVEAVRARYTKELTAAQKARFLARIGSRAIQLEKKSD
ncbi:Acetolactate synthase isozyme 2 large subunit [Gemmata obscuriglobus]|uniref:Thiamine pyrophosphate-binding protein n=1 Tax=Gemmata obscuriglobus TaxID=114 RepID=A0A2Z3HBX9_9BACT|nr:thiamine pyrophosphate-binding protein [Gemmata obscuriglobus]AWM40485.1 thiamine pyrophosphate-binding protein [Gemmata obscuriglobus]QEG26271.1 Acetolactate synthase isozyme 2 large subunit [Gemmata obscuriglobus]VTS01102.1 acetolactate synthase large subunit : Thiamine pyrophosphate central domain-containing protein OS=Isosphaera pallida (strain ATCC 43644 / DSM 9630 / IS1B) GN=Isop_2596 PE=3 SV=1: TPP_enzyme_N: TPP_enzyme_M: TPP_enzyme_C [Gemmata obscuriglobus UQM 2246]